MTTLSDLRAYEAKLIKALGDPTKAVFYDEFKKENRPISELRSALDAIRVEIASAEAEADGTVKQGRIFYARARSAL